MIKLFAIRDRLLDYFMQPYLIGHNEPEILSLVANMVNQEDSKHAVHTNPSHFEVWRLAEIQEQTGQVHGDREFLADCASLIRGSVREGGGPGASAIPSPNGGRGGKAPAAGEVANASQRPPADPPQAENGEGTESDP